MEYQFKNLVFEGGGVKGIAYLGALDEFSKRGIIQNIERVGGTSAGAITALLLGLKYSPEEIHEIAFNMNFNDFADDGFFLSDMSSLIRHFGWHRGKFFHNWARDVIKQKLGNPNATFADAQAAGCLGMYYLGTNISTGYAEIYSAEHTPNLPIADAVRISMSIPLYFAAMKNARGDILVDGGAILNYPVKLFDHKKYTHDEEAKRETEYYKNTDYVFNRETLGFRLDSKAEIGVFRGQGEPVVHKVGGFKSYMTRLVETLISAQDSVHLHSDDWQRTVYIDCADVGATDFEMDNAKKNLLIENGKKFAQEYFEWFDSSQEAVNKLPRLRRL
ncbi:MAG: patatin [Alphaproteobacteria bacterium CG11_big_fil_rev_8_21_14_0_20_44_7]|nr:MAG: patatin [Alphaproteobacteria bacterium CG11_big_fil_rev_8_21_14_0_20_44_7]